MPSREEKFLLFVGLVTMTPFFCIIYYHVNQKEKEEFEIQQSHTK
jgi:hypothetical protein